MLVHLLTVIISGISVGCLYGLLGLGIVLVFRSTNVVGFQQGELALFNTYIAWSLMQKLNVWVSIVLAIAISFLTGALMDIVFFRRLRKGDQLNAVIMSIGFLMVFNSVVVWKWQSLPKTFPSLFGNGTQSIGELVISNNSVGVMFSTAIISLVLFYVLHGTRLGLALRATAQNWSAAELVGIRVEFMHTLSWGLAGVLAFICGALVAPMVGLTPVMMVAVALYAFMGAVLGGLDSPFGVVLGGILIGVIENLIGEVPGGSDLKLVATMVFMIIVLVIKPQGLFGRPKLRKV